MKNTSPQLFFSFFNIAMENNGARLGFLTNPQTYECTLAREKRLACRWNQLASITILASITAAVFCCWAREAQNKPYSITTPWPSAYCSCRSRDYYRGVLLKYPRSPHRSVIGIGRRYLILSPCYLGVGGTLYIGQSIPSQAGVLLHLSEQRIPSS